LLFLFTLGMRTEALGWVRSGEGSSNVCGNRAAEPTPAGSQKSNFKRVAFFCFPPDSNRSAGLDSIRRQNISETVDG